jgi:hypothetical protein
MENNAGAADELAAVILGAVDGAVGFVRGTIILVVKLVLALVVIGGGFALWGATVGWH